MLRFWTLRKLDATLLDALIATPARGTARGTKLLAQSEWPLPPPKWTLTSANKLVYQNGPSQHQKG